jgi:hypothetical protein
MSEQTNEVEATSEVTAEEKARVRELHGRLADAWKVHNFEEVFSILADASKSGNLLVGQEHEGTEWILDLGAQAPDGSWTHAKYLLEN